MIEILLIMKMKLKSYQLAESNLATFAGESDMSMLSQILVVISS